MAMRRLVHGGLSGYEIWRSHAAHAQFNDSVE